ncbi:hypothetical protein [Aegicerativicinus sediminis]|uniref:hypothetical protein n=1 Tax=Aegicerativicinus sediminis TaxID=2893202 RepID=UPI001E2A4AE9|nr:hypothetical protein [Aegicerativicinus sediminis]
MIKKIETELMSIAHRILKLSGREDVEKMHEEVAQLYEKLSVLKFAKEHFLEDLPSIGESESTFFEMLDRVLSNNNLENESKDSIYLKLEEENEDEEIMEPVMEKIKNIVAHMPDEEEVEEDEIVLDQNNHQPEEDEPSEFDNLTKDFKDMPEFEPISKAQEKIYQRSVNDVLKGKGVVIGLNDKLAFIKHLFDGKREDYDRVLSQINTAQNFKEASNLIQNQVKPDYNMWKGKEEMEQRFLELIESKFD